MATGTSAAAPIAPAGAASRAPEHGGLPPGPRLPSLAQTVLWALAPTWLMDRCRERLGESFTMTFWPSGMQFVMISDPDEVKTLFTAPPELAPSSAGSSPVAPVMGANSVVVLTGPEHMRQRRLLLPPFHGERMREYEDVIVEATRRSMEGWPLEQPMRLQPHTRRITLEVILRAVFGVEAERMGPLRAAIEALFVPVHGFTELRIALSRQQLERPTGAFGEALDHLDRLIYEEVARRREQGDLEERADILSLLMLARDEEGAPMSDVELRDELVTLLLAGHETTSTSVAWAIERLVRHPRVLARLLAEIDAGESEDYLMAVVHETLRVRPVVPLVVRTLTGPMQLGGRELPADTRVVPSIYLTNRNPRVYEHPEEFRPERFLGSSPETFSWIPFGGGIRRCIGASFALQEMKLILRTALRELEPSAPRHALRGRRGEWIRRRAITLVPSRETEVVWRRRHAGSLSRAA